MSKLLKKGIPFSFLMGATSAVASGFFWVVDQGNSLELKCGENEVLARFLLDPEPVDPHFDVLRMVDGENLVWVGPEDHPWHYGQWFSWKYINGVNFWETNRKTGRSAGLTEVLAPTIRIDQDHAEVRYRRFYRLRPDENPVLEDEFTITIAPPEAADSSTGPTIDWTIRTHARVDLTLDRTPLIGEPGGKSWGGYAGLSWRGSKRLADVEFTDSVGRRGMEIHRERSDWVNAVGTIGGKPAGLAMLVLSNASSSIEARVDPPRDAKSWYIAAKEDLPFWFINPALLQPGAIVLEQGSSFVHQYRVVVHDGSWSPEQN